MLKGRVIVLFGEGLIPSGGEEVHINGPDRPMEKDPWDLPSWGDQGGLYDTCFVDLNFVPCERLDDIFDLAEWLLAKKGRLIMVGDMDEE